MIRWKILLAFVLTTVLTVSIVAGVVFKHFRDYAVENFSQEASGQLRRIDDIINIHMESAANAVRYMAAMPQLRDGLQRFDSLAATTEKTPYGRDQMNAYGQSVFDQFERIAMINPAFDFVYAGFTDTGYVQFPADTMPEGYNPLKREWFEVSMRAATDPSYTQPYVSSDKVVVTSVMHRIQNTAGANVGVAAIDFKLSTLTNTLSSMQLGKSGFIMLFDANGVMLVNKHSPDNVGKNFAELNDPFLNRIQAMESGYFEDRINGTKHFVQVYVSGATGWKIAVLRSSSEVLSRAVSSSLSVFYTGLTVLVLVTLISFFTSRSIARPISLLVDASGRIAEGDFDALPKNMRFSGELGHLQHSLERMVENLGQLIHTSNDKTREAEEQTHKAAQALEEAREAGQRAEAARREGMLQAAGQLESVVHELAMASEQIDLVIEETTRGLSRQVSITTETASAMDEMNASVLEVARNANDASNNAQQARKDTESGMENMVTVVKAVGDVQHKAGLVKDSLDALGEQAEAIGRIMGMISDIADQTNLLALNAAIEAARAGEAGRGFAVVADEVRKLAEKTMQATKEVGASVHGIQKGTEESRHHMQDAEEAISRTISRVKDTEHSLGQISTAIQSTAGQIRFIATAAEEQAATSQNVARNTGEINSVVDEDAKQLMECARLVSALKENAQALAKLVEALKS